MQVATDTFLHIV